MAHHNITDVSDAIRNALARDERTSVELASLVGINSVNLRKFKAGSIGLSNTTIDRLAQVLGLSVVVTITRKKQNNHRKRLTL